MEEKWWSKFQTKNDSQETKPEENVENTMPTLEDANSDKENSQENFFKTEDNSKEIFEDAINFIQDLNIKIDKTVDDVLENDDIRKWITDIDDTAKTAADTIIEKGTEFLNSKEVQEAAEKAKQVMNDVVNEVKSWSEHNSEEMDESASEQIDKKDPIFEENNEIKKDIDAIKHAVNESINRKEISESLDYVKSKAEEANKAVTSYLSKPEVIKTKEYLSDKVDNSVNWINEQMSKEEVADKINYMKDKADEAKKWVFQVYNSEDVQEGIEKAKESMNDVAKNTRATFVKTINDPRLQNGYVNAKETTIRTAKNISSGMKKGMNEFQNSENLSHELVEWKNSAIIFTKQSAKLIGATAHEIAQNEQIKAMTNKGKEAVLKGAHSALDALNKWADNKKKDSEINVYLENKEENINKK